MDNKITKLNLCKSNQNDKNCGKCIYPIANPVFLSKLELYDLLGLIIVCLSETNIYNNYICIELTYCNCNAKVSTRTVNIKSEYIYEANIVSIKYILETWKCTRILSRDDNFKLGEIEQVLDMTNNVSGLSIGLNILFKSVDSWNNK